MLAAVSTPPQWRNRRRPSRPCAPWRRANGGETVARPTARRLVEATDPRLYVIHLSQVARSGEPAHFRKGEVIEHVRDGVACGDHDQADRAGFEVAAIVARSICRYGSARNRREGTVEGAHDRANSNLGGWTGKRVPAPLALVGKNKTGVTQLGQDLIEEFFRNRIGFGDIRDLSQRAGRKPGQMHHGLEAVLSLLCEHDLSFGLPLARSPRRITNPGPPLALRDRLIAKVQQILCGDLA